MKAEEARSITKENSRCQDIFNMIKERAENGMNMYPYYGYLDSDTFQQLLSNGYSIKEIRSEYGLEGILIRW